MTGMTPKEFKAKWWGRFVGVRSAEEFASDVDALLGCDRRTPESYGLGLLTEECGELLEMVGKAGRFGVDTTADGGATARERIQDEAGDVLAAVGYLVRRGVLDYGAVHRRRDAKLARLLDPAATDNLGRRLAP